MKILEKKIIWNVEISNMFVYGIVFVINYDLVKESNNSIDNFV